ncbi:hypothetical protein ERN12_03090 [Rhodobacteraceae bacterium]|nr:hypothetical protein ERN12_03090 [Paracoccaceae bacterium]
MNPMWFLRMARWARHPPSKKQVKLVAVVAVIVIAIAAVEWLGFWPDWATVNPKGSMRLPHAN